VDVEDRVGLSRDELDELTAIVARHRTMEDVVRWGLMSRPARIVQSVVVQDEFTHDVVLPWGDVFLVYDTT
jgi:hypothetical protein